MNELLNRLKNSVNTQILNKVDSTLLEQYKFVPISVKDNFLFVAINSSSDKEVINLKLKEFYPQQVKFIQVPDQDLFDLIKSLKEDMQKESGDDGTSKQVKLGELLVQKGYINDVQLLQALAESKRQKIPIGSTLFKLGFITLDQLKEILHLQTGYDLVTPEQLAGQEKFVKILPEDFIKNNKIIPISSDGKTLILGVVTPVKPDVLKEIIYLTGQNPKQLLMTHYEFENSLNTFFSEQKKETERVIKEIESESQEFEVEESLADMVDKQLKDSTGSVAKFVNQIITNAIDNKVSDIHIEPRLSGYIVRYRKDGMLQKVLDIPPKVETSVIARFKVLSRMNIAEHRRPQDGTFSIKYKNGSYDFRINTLPVSGKEKVCIRVLAPAVSLNADDKNIKLVGGTEEDVAKIKNMVSCPNGIILTSGPTGSGKTTTLYSVLKSLNDEDVNITTIEDPIEIKLEGINQSQINAKAGITFASCMRAILRQDPDIILVGEIRDYETLEIAISAALTGHLVLSTVHTNSAAATVTRLIEMGAKDYLVSSTLSGVIAQRLVRRLCDDCKEEFFATHDEARQIIANEDEIKEFMKKPIYRAKGCNKCDFTGYKGRLGVYEIMAINKEIKKLVALGAHDLEIEEAAVKNGMKTLHQSCLNHILNGMTTIDEFVRVLGVVNE
ncbi:TPA: type II secretion system protein GspE [Candidatus Gastranaerophilales bacterium HUM_20]|nr:type II secretion system protein E [Clostridium sp. CAG:729]DAB18673.1 MAG TPA: type II secretion system protein GspE [Candidatus Gastranaerophilales bacterium HUM_20]